MNRGYSQNAAEITDISTFSREANTARGDVNMPRLKPSQIRFTQDSIAKCFQNGNQINSAIPRIEHGKLTPDDFPKIRVVNLKGKVYSLDNRRLYLFRVAEYRGLIEDVPVKFVSITRIPKDRFTTRNDGIRIELRGGGKTKDHYKESWLRRMDDAGNWNLPPKNVIKPAVDTRIIRNPQPMKTGYVRRTAENGQVLNRGGSDDYANLPVPKADSVFGMTFHNRVTHYEIKAESKPLDELRDHAISLDKTLFPAHKETNLPGLSQERDAPSIASQLRSGTKFESTLLPRYEVIEFTSKNRAVNSLQAQRNGSVAKSSQSIPPERDAEHRRMANRRVGLGYCSDHDREQELQIILENAGPSVSNCSRSQLEDESPSRASSPAFENIEIEKPPSEKKKSGFLGRLRKIFCCCCFHDRS